MNNARRQFLKKSTVGLLGLGFGPWRAGAQEKPAAVAQIKPVTRILGKTGIKLPVVSMGVMNADNPVLVRAALNSGIVYLDTAHGYQRGRNEEMVGAVVKEFKREAVVIATKVPGVPMDRETGLFSAETTGEAFLEKFELSLKRLGTPYVDILYLHNVWQGPSAQFAPLMKAMGKVKKEGKARFIGLSTHRNEPEVIRAAIKAEIYDVILTSYNFRQDHREEVKKAIAEAAAAGIGIVAMKTQAGIYFDEEKTQPINMKAALKWVLQDPNVSTAIPGFTTFEMLQEDMAVMADLNLSAGEMAELFPAPKTAGYFCDQCGSCAKQCVRKLPIPDLMRSYMYAGAYRNLAAANALLAEIPVPGNPCQDCIVCRVTCRKGFNIAERVKETMALKNLPETFWA